MTERISYLDFRQRLKPTAAKNAKYRNVRRKATVDDSGSEYNGRVYDSKAEAAYAAKLDLLVHDGQILGWIPQVSIPVPGTKKRMVLDFLVIHRDHTVRWEDYKGQTPTPHWQLKREVCQNGYGITIDIVSRTRRP